MFYIVETDESLNKLLRFKEDKIFVEVILSSNNFHPILNEVIGIYFKPIDEKGFIIPINHPDGLNFSLEKIKSFLINFNNLYVVEKKKFLYFFKGNNLIDIQLLRILNGKGIIESSFSNKSYERFQTKFYSFKDVGKVIPLVLHYEYCENLFSNFQDSINLPIPDSFNFYNNEYTYVFYLIEKEGLNIKESKFTELYKPPYPQFNIYNGIAYSYYNLYNITSRPTNSFNNINFLAIPHKDEYRQTIVPKNDYFVEFDFDGYHLRLLGKILQYPLTEEKAHRQIAKLYYGKDSIIEEEYLEVKQLNFQAIYGKIPEEYSHIKVFQLAKKYIDELWNTYQEVGYVKAPISYKPFFSNMDNMFPQKLMNYIIQSLETSRNVNILKKSLKFLNDKKSKIVLYTYDSIIIDFSLEDKKETLLGLESILCENNEFPVSFKYSKNLVF